MWLYSKNGFLSIIEPFDKMKENGFLLVRGRVAGDIEAHFPEAKVQQTPARDYLYRALVRRERVAQVLADQVKAIDYSNYKSTVDDMVRHRWYHRVWDQMVELQEEKANDDSR